MKWLLKRYMSDARIESLTELAKEIGMTRKTLYDRINKPQTLKAFEIAALDKVLHFSNEDLAMLIRGEI